MIFAKVFPRMSNVVLWPSLSISFSCFYRSQHLKLPTIKLLYSTYLHTLHRSKYIPSLPYGSAMLGRNNASSTASVYSNCPILGFQIVFPMVVSAVWWFLDLFHRNFQRKNTENSLIEMEKIILPV